MASQVKRAYSRRAWCGRGASATLALSAAALSLCAGAALAAPPPIRTSAQNVVPACVTPQRLMSFLKSRNPNLDARFNGIAGLYKWHGERWHVRWDYAFYQMAVETNFLSYKQGNGRWGDVDPRQNNFAGLGTTGGGVAGDSYPDVTTGVLAQIQHLVAYSGERVTDPVGARTKLKQDDIIESMAHLKGHVTFNDLSHRWAVDRHYGASIEWVAGNYRATYCKPGMQRTDAAPEKAEAKIAPVPTQKPAAELAPAEALGGPTTVAETTPEAAPDAAAPAEPATTQVASAEVAAAPETSTAAPVHTIWSRDKQDVSATTQETAEAASTTAPAAAAAATGPAPTVKTKAAQPMAPLPVAKATIMPTAPVAAAAETPASETPPVALAAADAAVLAVPGVKQDVVDTPEATAATTPVATASHVPEEVPVDEPKPAVVTTPVTAAAEAAPGAPSATASAPEPALTPPVDTRMLAFAPAINLAELNPSEQPKSGSAAKATGTCRVLAASYGGKKTLLVRTKAGAETHYTALTVLEGFEGSMLDNFVRAHGPGGASIGEYETKDAALAKAKELCPGSAAAPKAEGASAG
jgi:hypothetical protein